MRAALASLDLTHVQFVLLATLTWTQSEGPTTQRQLAQAARTDPMMTSQVLRALEGKGLIERRNHPHDARAKALRTTPTGAALANLANTVVEAVDADWFSPLGRDTSTFTHMLARLTEER